MKNKIILTHKHGRPSTKQAYDQMNSGTLVQRRKVPKTGNLYYRVFVNNDVSEYIKYKDIDLRDTVVVRWGSREEHETNEGTIIYNKSRDIEKATDKKKTREIFREKEVQCPKIFTEHTDPEGITLPIICRPPVHAKGKNFKIFDNPQRAEYFLVHNPSWYGSEFINKDREYRIHVAHGKVLAILEKQKPSEDIVAWNRAQSDLGFQYINWNRADETQIHRAIRESIKAVNSLNLDFGGVDTMTKDNEPYILEVNTAPTLNSSPYTASRWGQYFDWLFRSETRRGHWDPSQFERGKSLIWKNYQLNDRENG